MVRCALGACVAAIALACAVSSASAYDMDIAPGGVVTAAAPALGPLTFGDAGGLINVVCKVTLNGTLSGGPVTIAAGNQVGIVSGVNVGMCSGGTMAALFPGGTPYPITINRVLGTLSTGMTGLLYDIRGWSVDFTVTIVGIPVHCLYAGSLGWLVGVTGSNPYVTGTSTTVLSNSLGKIGGPGVCPASVQGRGTLDLSPQQTITVT